MIDVKTTGAVGDGVTDDTIALRRAFESGEDVYIPRGVYIASRLELPSGVRVVGSGRMSTILKNPSGGVLRLRNSRGLIDGTKLSDMTLEGHRGHLITFANIARSTFENLRLIQRDPDGSIMDTYDAKLMLACEFRNIVSYAYGVPRSVNAWNLHSTQTDAITENLFDHCTFWNGEYGGDADDTKYYFRIAAESQSNMLRNNIFRQCIFEDCRGGGIVIERCSGTVLDRCSLWDVPASTMRRPFISVSTARRTTIDGCGRVGDGPKPSVPDVVCDGGSLGTVVRDLYYEGSGVGTNVVNNGI